MEMTPTTNSPDAVVPPPEVATPPLPPPQPPPSLPPPPILSSQPLRPKKRRGWMVIALILLVLLGISLMFNVGHVVQNVARLGNVHARSGGPRLDETIFEDNDGANKIAVVDVEGIITGRDMDQSGFGMVEIIKAQLKHAAEDAKVKAVILKVDSPGGEVLASDEIYRAIQKFQKDSSKPVIASMGNLAASGGYYVSAPCRWIVANDLTITGSIGVILHTWNYRNLMNKVGLKPEVYKSGKFKDMLSGERDLDTMPAQDLDKERQMVQGLIDETFGKFKSVVAEGRNYAHEENDQDGKALAADWTNYADGRVLSGTEALKLGFVDQLGTFDDAVKRAKKIAGISGDVNLVRYQLRYDISDLFHMFGQSESRVMKVDLGIELPKLQAGQLYFLYLPMSQN